jgi:hypothetical protein
MTPTTMFIVWKRGDIERTIVKPVLPVLIVWEFSTLGRVVVNLKNDNDSNTNYIERRDIVQSLRLVEGVCPS